MININDYNNLNLIKLKRIYSFAFILILIFIISIIILNFKFDFFYYSKASYTKENDVLKIIIDENDTNKITDNNELIINSKKYEYKVIKLSKKILDSIPIQQYSEVIIALKLDGKYKIENNSIDFKIKYDSKKGFEIIKDFILGKGK